MKSKGFTLIEMLVVIAIVGVVLGLLLPVFSKTKEAAKLAACLSNIKQISYGLLVYAAEYDGRFPPGHQQISASRQFELATTENGPTYTGYFVDRKVSAWKVTSGAGVISHFSGHGVLFALDIIFDPRAFYCPSMRVDQLSYPNGWRDSNKRTCSYYYRLFGQRSAGIRKADVDRLHHYSLHDLKELISVEADIFHTGATLTGIGQGKLWAHRGPEVINVAFSDGHAEHFSDNAAWFYAFHAQPLVGANDRFVMVFWEYMDGDPDRMQVLYPIPPELLP